MISARLSLYSQSAGEPRLATSQCPEQDDRPQVDIPGCRLDRREAMRPVMPPGRQNAHALLLNVKMEAIAGV
ncbi:hypothetical protein [Sinorhizobium medicae]|uniref:hypothetical protein n=1 Tax=Sinorhizobium medicae TaxID=110321 RepID=UPI000FDA4791|nr:hypothetical protein [Sinorhizobium medicae]MDX1002178.1 hypothetical protein [Sinorhizobium medicae]RVO69094.1 hypothetical protein CN084_32420 [Sinorhizobium medicae]